MYGLSKIIIKYRWVVIILITAATIFFGWRASKIGLNADFSTYLNQSDPLVERYNRIGEVFGSNSIGIALISSKNIFSEENLQLIKKLTNAYRNIDGISYVTSLTNVVDFKKTEWGLEVGRLLNKGIIPQSKEELKNLKNYVMNKDRFVGNLVSSDGTISAIILKFDKSKSEISTSIKINEVTSKIVASMPSSSNVKIYFGGMPFLVFNMTTLITSNFTVLTPLMILFLLLVLFVGLRHWAGVVFPMLVVLISIVWTTGIMNLLGLKFNLLTGIMPVILLALGSADGIHLLKRYFEIRRKGTSAVDAAIGTYGEMGVPILFTTITTMVGFSSLVISDFSVIKEFGLLTALGMLIALLTTVTLLPALLSFGVKPPKVKEKKATGNFMNKVGSLIYNHPLVILLSSGLIVIISVIAIPLINKDVDWTLCLQKGSNPYHAEMLLREKFGGSLPVDIVIDGDLKDPAVLHIMRLFEQKLESIPRLSKSQSIASIIAEMNNVMNDRYSIPNQRQGISNLWFLIEGKDMMDQITANDDKEALLSVKLDTWHTEYLVKAVDSVESFLKTIPKKIAVIDLNKVPYNIKNKLIKLKKEEIYNSLNWTLEKYGITPDKNRLEKIVDKATNSAAGDNINASIQNAVADYLKSPQAEAELNINSVNRLSSSISKLVDKKSYPDSTQIYSAILSEVKVNKEDAGFLAASLEQIVKDTFGENRIQSSIARVNAIVPSNLDLNSNFKRDITGILWAVNENYLYTGYKKAEDLLGQNNNSIVRTVKWNFYNAGMPSVLSQMEAELTPTQTESLLITLIFVVIILSLLFRSSLVGALAVIPIILTILINFSVMGFGNIGLDSFTSMIASIAIGLGIDYAIHFTSRFKKEIKEEGDTLKALQNTLGTTGISILTNAFSVGLGFIVLLAAGGQHIRRFGGLTSLTMIVSAFLTLTLLPSLFILIKPKFLKVFTKERKQKKTIGFRS
ncbi:putative membrane protein YdgH [bacterium BMS3Abin03]|nr:putative membrane protein YdgH [bacterium BMS3Abin03]